jgi:sRNA-binding carbon storage regulator CsrA
VKTPDGVEITFKVIDQIGNRTKVGIDAPRVCRVRRTELEEVLEWQKRGAK